MNLDFIRLSQIPAPSTIFHLSSSKAGNLWAASPAGLFRNIDGDWLPVLQTFPFSQVGTVLDLGKTVLAAGLSGGLVYSRKTGENWQYAVLEQVTNPVTCLAASPNFAEDQVVLAGTAGDGVLRSVNGGQSWQLVNFGLRDFHIYALETASVWGLKEASFSGTANGIYYSPNGGRAWRFSGLDGITVLSLALHPDFENSPIILAGTENHGIWRSEDSGQNWSPVELPGFKELTINAFLRFENAWLAATSEAGVLTSDDDGLTWTITNSHLPPILTLAQSLGNLFAGTYQQGIYRSLDGGNTWEPVESWVAQRFSQLLAWPAFEQDYWVALGPQSGVWVSEDKVDGWQPLSGIDLDSAWYAADVCQDRLILGGSSGVYQQVSPLKPGRITLSSDQAALSLASMDAMVFAGTVSGQLWHSQDSGSTWTKIVAPGEGLPIISLGIMKAESSFLIVAIVLNQRQEQVEIWRSKLGLQGESLDQWQLWLVEKTIYRSVVMLLYGESGEASWFGIGNALIYRHNGEWRRKDLATQHAPLVAITDHHAAGFKLAAAGSLLWVGDEQAEWQKVTGMNKAFVDFASQESAGSESALYGLTSTGEVFRILKK